MTDSTNPTPHADPAMRPITIEIPLAVAQRLAETFEGTLEDAARAGLKLINGMGSAAYDNLQELAKQLDTSPAKALRAAIQLLVDDAARLNMTRGTVGRPKINEQRDAKLYERIKTGRTQAEVAAEFGLSIVRVGQIVALHRLANGDAPRRGRGRSAGPNPRKSFGQPNLMRMYDELDAGMTLAVAASTYELELHRVRDLYAAYTAQLAGKTKITAYDRMQAAHQATLAPETAEVLTLKETTPPAAPKKLAVIPPSVRNPELFAQLKPIEPVDYDNLDNTIFGDDYQF
jgi:hypothetical protein